ncbi:MAG: hypothetical protein Q4C56_08070 [Peptococcaceae bacterium]|nr:hypothetical protein [Peptococcaceae bacterium]
MSKRAKKLLTAVLLLVAGFACFAAFSFGAGSAFGILAMLGVGAAVYFMVTGFAPAQKKPYSPIYKDRRSQAKKK